jgi:hypothetical protein
MLEPGDVLSSEENNLLKSWFHVCPLGLDSCDDIAPRHGDLNPTLTFAQESCGLSNDDIAIS